MIDEDYEPTIAANESADLLAEQAGIDPAARRPKTAGWTTQATWYDTTTRLLAVVSTGKDHAADIALAHGLALRDGKQLDLVLPTGWVEPTRRRLPWLGVPVGLWRHHDGLIEPVSAPATGDHPFPPDDDHPALHLLDRTSWVADLMTHAGANPDLDPGHRQGVRAWHCRGTRVLKITRTRQRLRIVAGIAFKEPGQAGAASTHEISGPLTAQERTTIETDIQAGIDARLGGAAGGYNEHWLQAVLRRRPDLLGLEQPVLREVPAWRPVHDPDASTLNGYGRGFLDLVGLDARGDMHLVETKLASDDKLVLQGVDYLAWATVPEHRRRLATRLECREDVPLVSHFVIGAETSGSAAVGRYARAQAAALRPDIQWRFSIVTGWQHGTPVVTPLPLRTTPDK